MALSLLEVERMLTDVQARAIHWHGISWDMQTLLERQRLLTAGWGGYAEIHHTLATLYSAPARVPTLPFESGAATREAFAGRPAASPLRGSFPCLRFAPPFVGPLRTAAGSPACCSDTAPTPTFASLGRASVSEAAAASPAGRLADVWGLAGASASTPLTGVTSVSCLLPGRLLAAASCMAGFLLSLLLATRTGSALTGDNFVARANSGRLSMSAVSPLAAPRPEPCGRGCRAGASTPAHRRVDVSMSVSMGRKMSHHMTWHHLRDAGALNERHGRGRLRNKFVGTAPCPLMSSQEVGLHLMRVHSPRGYRRLYLC